jgi:glycosyltransferase involved in cell wall biosynthesis
MTRFPESWKKLNPALSHDWLTGMRGGERVLELLCEGFPAASVYTLIHNPSAVSPVINAHPIWTSRLQHVPGILRWYRYFLPFFPGAVEAMCVSDGELLISMSHCVAKGLRPSAGMKHLCYCFTPMRYAWTFYEEYFGRSTLKKTLLSPILRHLRDWDRRTADRVDQFVTLSQHVRDRIRVFYDREAEVVYPPVKTEFFTPDGGPREDFDVIVSALVPYKRLDLAVDAYAKLGRRLKIVGAGTDLAALRKKATPNIELLGWLPNEEVRELYRRARCLVFPGEEDFGIVPVEAQACGCPVVAYARGGVMESLVENVSGVAFREQTAPSLLAAIEDCLSRKWDASAIRRSAERFSEQVFIDNFGKVIGKCLGIRP